MGKGDVFQKREQELCPKKVSQNGCTNIISHYSILKKKMQGSVGSNQGRVDMQEAQDDNHLTNWAEFP